MRCLTPSVLTFKFSNALDVNHVQYSVKYIHWVVTEFRQSRVVQAASKAQLIRRAAAAPNQIGRIKFGSSTVAVRRMNRA